MPTRFSIRKRVECPFYTPNHFMIVMDEDTPFLVFNADTSNQQNNRYLSVFCHEYWHYLHNITTISGFKSFAFTQNLSYFFNKTLLQNGDGKSSGGQMLSLSDKRDLANLLLVHRYLEGDIGPSNTGDDWEVNFIVLDYSRREAPLSYVGNLVSNKHVVLLVKMEWPDSRPGIEDEFILGSCAIEESVAYMVEKLIARDLPDIPSHLLGAPVFPYRVLSVLFDFIVGDESTPEVIKAGLGTLSLLTPYPGYYLSVFLENYSDYLNSGASPFEGFEKVVDSFRGDFENVVNKVLTVDLPNIVGMYHKRGLNENALKWISSLYERAFNLRKNVDIVFELAAFKSENINVSQFEAFQAIFPPCDTLQCREQIKSLFPRDQIASFHKEEKDGNGHTPTDYLRSFQSQQEFVSSHVDYDLRSFYRSSDVKGMCPYYHSCDVSWRLNAPQNCRNSPWEHFDINGKESCWYTNGVSAVLGTVSIGNK